MNITAFIPARGGSKGIPRKNLTLLGGKPLIQHTIEAALMCGVIDDVFISSDNDEIISFCQSLGLEVPYKRPAELAQDQSSIVDCALDMLEWKQRNGLRVPDAVLLLQPTSPLRQPHHISEMIQLAEAKKAQSAVSVHTMSEHPYECIEKKDSGWNFIKHPSSQVTGRQSYKNNFYFLNGAMYFVTTDFLISNRSFFSEGSSELYVMDAIYGADIDEPSDLKYAEFCFDQIKPTIGS